MRIPTARPRPTELDQSAMTPLIDIVFQLLIFFICASSGHLREWLLPADFGPGTGATTAEVVEKPLGEVRVRLTRVDDQPRILIESMECPDWGSVRETFTVLAETAIEIPVILDISPDSRMEDVVRVYDLCRAAGFRQLAFSAKGPARP